MRYISSVIIMAVVLLLNPSFARAEVKEIIAEGAYNMGDGETPSVAESRALFNAKRIALEQAGTYVESYIKVENLQLTKDEIQVIASGIMEVEILDRKRTVVGDGIHFWVKIKAKIAPAQIEDMAKRVKEKSVVEDYKKVQDAYAQSEKEIEALKKQLAEAKGEKQRKQVEARITDEERLFQANEWFYKGYGHSLNKEYDDALEAYTNAIAINPNYADAYNTRGVAYMGQLDRAIEDYNKAIAINSNHAEAYINRGNAYYKKGQLDRTIEDYNKAIALSPNSAQAYNNRGNAYDDKGQLDRAIEDFNKAIAINPNLAEAYINRGVVYYNKGQLDRAIEDYNKAIAINPNDAEAYYNRGNAYYKKGQHDRAIEDYNKAIALSPNSAQAYNNRGLVYYMNGQLGRAISDLQKACDMGVEGACRVLKKVLQDR